jgi:thiol-disulfide isomerase/thioredoxin
VALFVASFILYANHQMKTRASEPLLETRARTRPLLAAPELPDVGVATLEAENYGTVSYDWSLIDLSGNPVPFERFRDRVLLIDFWAMWCAPCVAELPGLSELRRQVGGGRVEIVLISDEDPATVRQYAEEHDVSLPLYAVADGVPSAIHPRVRPEAFIVDCSGRVVFRLRGGVDWSGAAVAGFLRGLATRC